MNNSKAFDGYDSWLLSGIDDELEMEISMNGDDDEVMGIVEEMALELLDNDRDRVSEILSYDETWQSTAIAVAAEELTSPELTQVVLGVLMTHLIDECPDDIVDQVLAIRAAR